MIVVGWNQCIYKCLMKFLSENLCVLEILTLITDWKSGDGTVSSHFADKEVQTDLLGCVHEMLEKN